MSAFHPARHQRGLTTVEFAIISVLMMVVLFGVLEFGRLLHTYSVLSEGTRRGARVAAVCPINDAAIVRATMFGGSPVSIPGLTPTNVRVEYLDANGGVIGAPAGAFTQINYVRVRIVGLRHEMIIPTLDLSFTTPEFPVTLPAESLGMASPTAVTAC